MSRQPNDATTIRNLRRELADAQAVAHQVRIARHEAMQARAEIAEWKRRFDLLLARTPEVKP